MVDIDAAEGSYLVEAKYLLGADGAGSSVRRSLGIEPIGPHSLQTFVMVHIGADFGDCDTASS